ncbi:hypothetical protein HKX48_000716 [Thoreauomyces humboldtii]|nr:hypothetical protein HKX48_000716 [Thoreauomyces humboldtii]
MSVPTPTFPPVGIPLPGHLTEDPSPLSLSSSEYNVAVGKAFIIDEVVPLAIPGSLIVGPTFTYVRRARVHTLFSHNNPDSNDITFANDLADLSRELKTGDITPAFRLATGSGSFASVSHAGLESAMFVKSDEEDKLFLINNFSNLPILDPIGLIDEYDFIETKPDDAYWAQLVKFFADVHGWTEPYTSKLPAALSYMSPFAAHHLAIHRPTGLPVAEICVRYVRGVAFLQSAATSQTFRRRGLCRALYARAAEAARRKGYPGMALVPQDDRANATWRSVGFTIEGGNLQHWKKG